ncbi:MAG TPA: hypothetical protein DIV54_05955 [Verrucomicrobiales bacterium]|nr:hypothetical protein [Roseibacillus sp.]HCQ33025.1 hypothetical protein [Verrucomicrobiales bacterium]
MPWSAFCFAEYCHIIEEKVLFASGGLSKKGRLWPPLTTLALKNQRVVWLSTRCERKSFILHEMTE